MNPVDIRLLNQQLICPQFDKPIIAHDGIISGNWTPFKDDLQATFFMGEHKADLQEEWKRYKTYQIK